MRNSSGGPNHRQDWVQDEALLDVFEEVVWVFYCKKYGWGEYKRTQQVQSHPRGGYNRNQCTGQSKGKVMVHLRKISVVCKGSFKNIFQNKFLCTKEHMILIHTGSKF
jgi:hypothetical protein